MVKLATGVMLGEKLADLGWATGLVPPRPLVAVKAPVFSMNKLAAVDSYLGPEMKSTGEAIGIAGNLHGTLRKAFAASGMHVERGSAALLTIADADKPELFPIVSRLVELGCRLVATDGTARALRAAGFSPRVVAKIGEEGPTVVDVIVRGEVQLVINTMSNIYEDRGDGTPVFKDGFEIRRAAVERRIPCLTSLDTATALLESAVAAPHEIAAGVRAGQFVNLGWTRGPLLRRPFSVYRVDGETIEVVLKDVGAGTRELLAMSPGDRLSCLGPLGHGFDFETSSRTAVLISGGLGVAPMPLAARDAKAKGMRVTWVHGARSAEDLCRESDGDEVIWATDDGSRGVPGTAVAAAPFVGLVIACGPNRMLAAVAERWPDAQVAVETYMGCGTGVCLGCAVPLKRGGYDRACKEGPVYRAADVDWSALPSHLHYDSVA